MRQVAHDTREWVAVGTIDKVDSDDNWRVSLLVKVGNDVIPARPAWLGADGGRGLFHRYEQGAEVLLFFPFGDRNNAIALLGPASNDQRPTTEAGAYNGWDNASTRIVDPDAVDVMASSDQDVQNVCTKGLVDDLSTYLGKRSTSLNTQITKYGSLAATATAGGAPLSGLAADFTAIATALGIEKAGVDLLKARPDVSKAGPGGPHLSDVLRATVGSFSAPT